MTDHASREGSDQTPQDGVAEVPQRPGYLKLSRGLGTSLVLVTPLFLFYQIGLLTTDGWRNGADLVTGRLFEICGRDEWRYIMVNFAILFAIVALAYVRSKERRPTAGTLLFVVSEATLYASVMGVLISRLLLELGFTAPSLSLSTWDNLVLSIGAGTHEELVFRLVLFSATVWGLRRLKVKKPLAIAAAFLISSLVFSAFHYVPLGTESWELWSFAYRFCAGLVFAALFVVRGFAVAVYTHAIYDIFVLVL